MIKRYKKLQTLKYIRNSKKVRMILNKSDEHKKDKSMSFLDTRSHVNIKYNLYQIIKKKSKEESVSIRKIVNNIIQDKYEHDDFIKLIAPKLSIIDFSEKSIIVKDESATNVRFAVVGLIDGLLCCDLDNDKYCTHIRFCTMSHKLRNLKNLKSF